MTKRTFRPQKPETSSSLLSEAHLTDQPVAVYYRQSTAAQVGNLSTAMQTIDMVEELVRRGWDRDSIILIDTDEGVSGTKRIDERQGMSYLFELIADKKVGSVACQDEDRLFRDMTQIQVNIFIDTCRKSQVKVITPYFTYDFAHPLQGEFHARQFRFKCEMAADYLKSYVLGRLAPARQRLQREGRWAGATMPVGYMVDNRKFLPDGTENPQWRRFVPFEPYAEIVREHFRVFLECGGQIRSAMRRIREKGLSFPNVRPPDGFKACYLLKDRGNGRYLNRGSFIRFLTNPVYIGHWCYQGVIVSWNNHAPIIDVDTFMRAFNALSKYTLTGEENDDYRPAYPPGRPNLEATRPTERPLLTGLIQTRVGEKWHRAGCMFESKNACYLYALYRTELEGTALEWVRRSSWIDEAVVRRFKRKLQSTYDTGAWVQALRDTQRLAERERKVKQLQLESLREGMQNLVLSLKSLSHPYLIQEVENRFVQMEAERDRLERELAAIDLNQQRHVSIEKAAEIFMQATASWGELTQDERRNILALFIDWIEATDYNRSGDMRLIVYWRDGSTDEIRIWHKPHSSDWSIENVENLLKMVDEGASQLEVAAAFPSLKWGQIYVEIRKHRGRVRFTPSWLGKDETYGDYVASGGRKGKASGSSWYEDEIALLRDMVERQASQVEIMQQFPYRRWIHIKSRIKDMFGKGVGVPMSGISQRLTYVEYDRQQKTAEVDPCSERLSSNF